eukprot:5215944-Pyramimonas_sp.AAC.1
MLSERLAAPLRTPGVWALPEIRRCDKRLQTIPPAPRETQGGGFSESSASEADRQALEPSEDDPG